MPSKKAIKLRVSSVTTTKQIVKAMDMVAGTKLRKVRKWLYVARPQAEESKRMLDQLKCCEQAVDHPFFEERLGKRAAYAVISSDRGLCGSYNTNIGNAALRHMKELGCEEQIFAIGLRGREFLARHERNIVHWYQEISETTFYEDARMIADTLIERFLSGEVDEVYVAYTHFASVLNHEPRIVRVLPLGGEEAGDDSFEMSYGPDLKTVLDYAVPVYLHSFLYSALLESAASEQASRMISMEAATKNASEIIDNLSRIYNRKRQADITQEITEIIGGAEVSGK